MHIRGVRRHPSREVDHDEGRRSGRRDDGLLSGVVILIQAHACTSDPVARVQAPFPRTQGRLLSCGFFSAGPRNASRSDVDTRPQSSPPGNGRVCHRTGGVGGKGPGTWHSNAPKQRPFPHLCIHSFLPKKNRQRLSTEYLALGVPTLIEVSTLVIGDISRLKTETSKSPLFFLHVLARCYVPISLCEMIGA